MKSQQEGTDSSRDLRDANANGAKTSTLKQHLEPHFNGNEQVIGLQFSNGQIFYFFRSTLVNKSGHFAKRFQNKSLDMTMTTTTDALGRPVYFLERDGDIFQQYILPYMLSNNLPILPPYSQDTANLWRSLRRDAEYFEIKALTQLLYVTRVCSPTNSLGHGVLHYIATCNTQQGWNPHALATVPVIRDGHFLTTKQQQELLGSHDIASTTSQVMVQYRPTVSHLTCDPRWLVIIGVVNEPQQDWCRLFSCHKPYKAKQLPVMIDLRSIQLRLFAYSLDKHAASNLKSWTMEGSADGLVWTELHTWRRGDQATNFSQKQIQYLKEEVNMVKNDIMIVPKEQDPRQKLEIVLDEAEYSKRKVFEISSPPRDFFRFFRFLSVDATPRNSAEEEDSNEAMHSPIFTKRDFRALGLELFGEIHEE